MKVHPVTCTVYNPDGSLDVCIIDEVFSNKKAAFEHAQYMVSIAMEYHAAEKGFTSVKESFEAGQIFIYYRNGQIAEAWELWSQEVFNSAKEAREYW